MQFADVDKVAGLRSVDRYQIVLSAYTRRKNNGCHNHDAYARSENRHHLCRLTGDWRAAERRARVPALERLKGILINCTWLYIENDSTNDRTNRGTSYVSAAFDHCLGWPSLWSRKKKQFHLKLRLLSFHMKSVPDGMY